MPNICLYFFCFAVCSARNLCYLVYFPVFISRLGYLFLFYLRISASFTIFFKRRGHYFLFFSGYAFFFLSVCIVTVENILNFFLIVWFYFHFFPFFKLLIVWYDNLIVWPVEWVFEGGLLYGIISPCLLNESVKNVFWLIPHENVWLRPK